jgi:uncharacterized repeat protein (TIGR03843 family)
VSGHERASHATDLGEITDALREGPIEVLGLLPNASNAALLVRCGGASGAEPELAVYKPAAGETPLWDFPEGTLHRREVAAYEVAHALGWPNVPATVLRDGPHGPGSLQRFVRFDPDEHYFTLTERHRDACARIAAFDLVTNNADRKGGHLLLDDDDRIWVIDHGVCFAVEPKLRTVIWDFIDEPLPEGVLPELERLVEDVRDGELGRRLAPLLDADEIQAVVERARTLLAAGVFPAPDPDTRPFPWPPI